MEKGFVELNTTDGPFLKMEAGLRGGKVLPGGIVEIAADEPRIVVTDHPERESSPGRALSQEEETRLG
jgi:hypothetical protein